MFARELDIIIITYKCLQHTINCIESIKSTLHNVDYSIIIVDNNSKDDTVPGIKEKYPEIKIIENDDNLGYAKAVNIGARNSDAEFLLISNADVIYKEETINTMLKYLAVNPTVGVVGSQQIFADGSWQYSYGDLPGIRLGFKDLFMISTFQRAIRKVLWNKIKIDRFPKSVGYADGGSLMTPMRVFGKVGGFDEDYYFYTEEADYCYKVQIVNFYVIFNPKVQIIHHRGGSSDNRGHNPKMLQIFVNSKILFCKKHYSNFTARIFKQLELWHSLMMAIFWNMASKILSSEKSRKATNKYNYFKMLSDTWKNAE